MNPTLPDPSDFDCGYPVEHDAPHGRCWECEQALCTNDELGLVLCPDHPPKCCGTPLLVTNWHDSDLWAEVECAVCVISEYGLGFALDCDNNSATTAREAA